MEAVPRPSSIAYVPPELDDLVVRMLAKDPTARPPLAEVTEVIERTRVLARTKVTRPVAPPSDAPAPPEPAPAPPSPSGARRTGKPWKAVLALAAFSAVVVATFLAVRASDDTGESIDAAADNPAPAVEERAARTLVSEPIPPAPAAPKADPPVPPGPKANPPEVEPPGTKVTQPAPASRELPRPSKPKLGRLELRITGATAPKIMIDGKPRTAVTALEPGDHMVEVSGAGTSTFRYIVTIVENETAIHAVDLSPIEKRLP